MTLGFVIAAMQQITAGLRHLHSLGILHRDLRAANVLLVSLKPLKVCLAVCVRVTREPRHGGGCVKCAAWE